MDNHDVLVVDDDDAVRAVTSEMLVRLGYTVVTAEDGARALRSLAENEVQVVLLDLSMPGLSGFEVYEALRRSGNSVHVVFMTGYASSEVDELVAADSGVGVLTKPFPLQELKDSIENALLLGGYSSMVEP